MDELILDVEPDEDGRLVAVGRGASIFTDGSDWDDLKRNVQEVVDAFFYDRPKPSIVRLHMMRDEILAVA
jgi:hypothetical protein